MKYYKKLWERKKYGIFFLMICLVALGLFVVFSAFSTNQGSGVYGIKGGWVMSFSAGRLFYGIIIVYTGVWFLPTCTRKAQDVSEYQVTSDENYIDIHYGKYYWKIPVKQFSPMALLSHDKEHHFVPISVAYRVYSMIFDWEQVRNPGGKCVSSDRIFQIEGSRKLSQEEKKVLLKKLKLNRSHPFLKMGALFSIIGSLTFIDFPQKVIDPTMGKMIGAVILAIVLGGAFLIGGVFCFWMSCEDKREYQYMLRHDIYKVRVYYCDKRYSGNYSIQISDGRGVVFTKFYPVTKEQYDRAESMIWHAYYYRRENGFVKIRLWGEA